MLGKHEVVGSNPITSSKLMTMNLRKHDVFEMLLDAIEKDNKLWIRMILSWLLSNKSDEFVVGNISKSGGIEIGLVK